MSDEVDLEDISFIEGAVPYKTMDAKERLRFNRILRQLMYETENGLTATEYYYLAMLKFFGEDIETFMLKTKFVNADEDLRKEYRMMAEDVLGHMQKHRDSKRIVTDSTKKLKELIKEETSKHGNDNRGEVSAD